MCITLLSHGENGSGKAPQYYVYIHILSFYFSPRIIVEMKGENMIGTVGSTPGKQTF